jgi:hypothetical protein
MNGTLSIWSVLAFNCNPAKAAWKVANDAFVLGNGRPSWEIGFYCRGKPIQEEHLSTAAKIGIGFALGIPCLIALIIADRIRWERKKELEATVKKEVAGQELEERVSAE